MAMRRALGRGLEALLPGAPPQPVASGQPAGPAPLEVAHREASPEEKPAGTPTVPIADITTNPDQPRRRFDPEALNALAESIRRHGLLQPLVVCRAEGGYQLIAGERRLRAARLAGFETVPVTIREADPPDRLELALIENLQREELTPLEEAEAYRQLIEVYGLTQEEIAQRVGKSRPAVANALRLLALPDSVKAQLEGGELSAGHARAVLSVEGDDAREAFAREIAANKLPKSEAERLARARRNGPGDAGAAARRALEGARRGSDPRTRHARADPASRARRNDRDRVLLGARTGSSGLSSSGPKGGGPRVLTLRAGRC